MKLVSRFWLMVILSIIIGCTEEPSSTEDADGSGDKSTDPAQGQMSPMKIPAGRTLATYNAGNTSSGLAGRTVYSIVGDDSGRIFFGTDSGLSSYDGQTFVNSTTAEGLPGNTVYALAIDDKAVLWIGTNNGAAILQAQNFKAIESTTGSSIEFLCVDIDGRIWFGLPGGIIHPDDQMEELIEPPSGLLKGRLNACLFDRSGWLWLAGEQGGAIRKGTAWVLIDGSAEIDLPSMNVLYEDDKGAVWIGTTNGVYVEDGDDGFTHHRYGEGLAGQNIHALTKLSDGRMVFASSSDGTDIYSGGVTFFDGSFRSITVDDGLANNNIFSLYQDKNDRLWFGTWGSGISRLVDSSFTTFDRIGGLSGNQVRAIGFDALGNVYFSGMNGLDRFDGSSWDHLVDLDPLLSGTIVQAMYDDPVFGQVLGTSRGELIVSENGSWRILNDSEDRVSFPISTIVGDGNGGLFVGTEGGGLLRFDGTIWQSITSGQGLSHDFVTTIVVSKDDKLLVGTLNGLSVIDGEEIKAYRLLDGLASIQVFSIFEDQKSNLWLIGENGRTSKFDGTNWVSYEQVDLLRNLHVSLIRQYAMNDIWIGTNEGGIVYLDEQGWHIFDRSVGLAGNTVLSIERDGNSRMFIGTTDGVSVLTVSADQKSVSEKPIEDE